MLCYDTRAKVVIVLVMDASHPFVNISLPPLSWFSLIFFVQGKYIRTLAQQEVLPC